jgi:peptide/nickel transport system permease protein
MRLIARRIALYAVTAIVAITINFFLPRLMPGNPALAVLGKAQSAESPQAVTALEVQYGVQTKTGMWGQYVQYWDRLLHGNLGTSLNAYPASVGSLIRADLPWTLALVGTATVISFVLGTLLGVAAAWRRGSWLDNLLPAITFFQAAPYFFVAILAVALFATKLGWFPPGRGYDTATLNPGFTWAFLSDVLDHAVLPALTIVLASVAGWIIGMRNMMITTADEDYVLLAQAKGPAQAPGDRLRGTQRAAAQRVGLCPGHRVHRLRRAAHRDRLLLPRPRLTTVQLHRQRRLPGAAGDLPDHHDRGAAGEPARRLRLRLPRPQTRQEA